MIVCIPPAPAAHVEATVVTDTAQVYRNEEEVGRALRESGLAREDVYITTKYWGINGMDIGTSIHDSLKKVRLCLRSVSIPLTTEITNTTNYLSILSVFTSSTDGGVMLARARALKIKNPVYT
jgi:hypothetical protein